MYYLVFPDGSKLFQTPYPEDFVYHCLLLAIDKGLGLQAVKVLDYRGLYFFRFLSVCRKLPPFPCLPFNLSALINVAIRPGGFAGGRCRDFRMS